MQISELISMQPLVFVGLGNTGAEYKITRHNAGFIFLEQLRQELATAGKNIVATKEKYFLLLHCTDPEIFLLEPNTMMNKSGTAVAEFFKNKNLDPATHLCLIHDDLDIALGSYKLQLGRSPKNHNGVTSVEQALGSKNFYRLRLGIENRTDKRMAGIDYVLGKFSAEELANFHKVCRQIIADLLA